MVVCQICKSSESKYKCSKCLIQYCSLPCYKSPDHKHDDIPGDTAIKKNDPPKPKIAGKQDSESEFNPLYSKLLNDERLKYYLNHPVVQKELTKINELVESDSSQDFDKSNDYLLNLRQFGKNENVLIEEFCSMVTMLLEQKRENTNQL